MSEIIQGLFQALYGQPCWHVRQGYGSFLTLEFGQPHLEIIEPRQVSNKISKKIKKLFVRRQIYVHGDWHLWVYICDWRILTNGKELANQDSKRRKIRQATAELDGQILTRVKVKRSLKTIFDFDLGGRIEVWPNTADYDEDVDLWLLYEWQGNVFVLRADGQYRYSPGVISPEAKTWQPIFS